jgi:hypothetical protein
MSCTKHFNWENCKESTTEVFYFCERSYRRISLLLLFRQYFITRAIRGVTIVEQELPNLQEHLSAHCGFPLARYLDVCAVYCRSCYAPLSFFFWPLPCLYFSDLTDSGFPFGILKVVITARYLYKPRWQCKTIDFFVLTVTQSM